MYQRIPGPYRGYKKKRRKLRGFFAVLFAALVLAFVVFFLMQDYLVFSVDGVKLELPFSFFKEKGKDDLGSLPIEIEKQDAPPSQEKPSEIAPATKSPEETSLLLLNAVCADVSKIGDSEYRKKLLSLPYVNAVIVDLKLPDGSVTYPSKAAVKESQKKVSDAVPNAIKEFSENGIYVIGRMSAFRDNIAPRTSMRPSSVKTKSGVTWLDYDYLSWLDPYKEETAKYLSALALEASDLGCDELMLNNFCFPVIGKTEMVTYADSENIDRVTAIGRVLNTLNKALEDRDMVLSVMTEDTASLTGKDLNAGQDVTVFLKTGRIFVNASEASVMSREKWDKIVSGAFDKGRIIPVLGINENNKSLSLLPKEVLEKCGFVLSSVSGDYTADNFGG